MQYFSTLDTAVVQCTERFSQEGLQRLQKLEDGLISGKIDPVLDEYPELNAMALEVQLKMFQANYKYATSPEVADILREMVPEV